MGDSRFKELDCLYTPQTQRLLAGTAYKLVLATMVVQLAGKGGGFLVRRQDGHWMPVSDGTKAVQVLKDQWCGISLELPNGGEWQINTQALKMFVMGHMAEGIFPDVPVIDGTMMVPVTEAQAISFQGKTFLNTWRNTIMPGDKAALEDATVRQWVTVLLRMIREGLAAQDDVVDLETMISKLHARAADEIVFRFIMSWWAAQIQRPGINLMTNLCHLGFNQGVGKGTMQTVMGRIMGGSLVLTANADEFARGWSDQMLNRLTVCINEIGPNNNKRGKGTDWYGFAKEYCQEEKITVATRYFGIGSGAIPNFTNWCFTSNDERPFRMDEDDRRMAMFPTTYNKGKNSLAQQVQALLHDSDPALAERVLQGFASILHSLPVEYDLIKQPVENGLREENKAANVDDVLYWLLDDQTYDRDTEHKPGYWTAKYNEYLGCTTSDDRMQPKAMSAKLQGLVRRQEILGRAIEKGRAPNGKARRQWLFTVPFSNFPRDAEADADSKKQRQQRMYELRGLPAPEGEPTRH